MSSAMLYRLSGLALLAGTLLAVPSAVVRLIDFNIGYDLITEAASPLFVPLHLMGLIAAMLILLGLPGMLIPYRLLCSASCKWYSLSDK
jgi:hypothetical protein